MFVTRHFSFSPFNNGDRNFVTLNNDSFVPMGAKYTQVTMKKKHSRKQILLYSWKLISISNERLTKTTFSLVELSSCSFALTVSAGKQ